MPSRHAAVGALATGQEFMRTKIIGRPIRAGILAFLASWSAGALAQPSATEIDVDKSRQIGASRLTLGVTLTRHYSSEPAGTVEKARAEELLTSLHGYVNIFVMGFGSGNPEPSPGVYNWEVLDERLAEIRQRHQVPIITLCCAPDWMKGGAVGETDWSRLPVAPLPEHFQDYADLAVRVAKRYPDVKYYQVWAELKGFWNRTERRWDYEGYTTFYNMVYDALKAVSSDIEVGGPYVHVAHRLDPGSDTSEVSGPYGTMSQAKLDVVTYWLAHKNGADFLSVDGGVRARDGIPPDLFGSTRFFADATRWLRERTNLPIWWSEWYAAPEEAPYHNDVPIDQQNVLDALALRYMAPQVTMALRWAPRGTAGRSYEGDQESLWSDTREPGGAMPFPFYYTYRRFAECFPAGAALYDIHVSSSAIIALASENCTMLINQTAEASDIRLNGQTGRLKPFNVDFYRSDGRPMPEAEASANPQSSGQQR
jgi:hypothetical protein